MRCEVLSCKFSCHLVDATFSVRTYTLYNMHGLVVSYIYIFIHQTMIATKQCMYNSLQNLAKIGVGHFGDGGPEQ